MIQQNQILKFLAVTLLATFFFKTSFSQGLVNVNNITGTASVVIPFKNVSVGDISAPVALSYNASGLKVENYDNSFGLGWDLVAGASITRDVKGFPDEVEYQGDPSYGVIKGWLRPSNAAPQTIQNFTPSNNGTSCANEMADASTIANNFSYTNDTESDHFYINAPGLNCSFVFDATSSHNIKTLPYKDYKITYTSDNEGLIDLFTVINESGIKYVFKKVAYINHKIDLFIPGPYTPPNDPSTLEAFKRDYLMYRAKFDYAGNPTGVTVKYYDQWVLDYMEDTKGNRIIYTYELYNINNPEIKKRNTYKEIEILKADASGNIIKKKLYGVKTESTSLRLLNISTLPVYSELGVRDEVIFNWGGVESGSTTEDKRLINVNVVRDKKIYELLYTEKFKGTNQVWYDYGRYFLEGVKSYKSDNLCDNVNTQFDFTYYGVDESSHTCYCVPHQNTQITDTIINAQDYWGYFNGQVLNANLNPQIWVYPNIPSGDQFKVYPIPNYAGVQTILSEQTIRTPNINAKEGSLKTITNPNGGVTTLEYENNEFFDSDINGNVVGGGIRIKKITDNDGLGANNITNYEYNEPANTSLTTGRAISVPKFTIAFQNNTSYPNISDKVKFSTYRTLFDLNKESKQILYGKVTVKKTGVGKTIYEYNTTGTFGSTATSNWSESINFIARKNLTSPTPCNPVAPSFLINNILQYPFTPNANFDFERGLLQKITHYNESNQVVASEEYAYDRSHDAQTSDKIYALKVDDIGNNMVAYGKYPVNATVDNFLITKTSKIYNSTNPASNIFTQDVENFVYTPKNSSLPYRILNEVNKQNSDGTTITSKFKYAKEYTPLSSGDDMNNAIKEFNNTNQNVIIESITNKTEGGISKTIGGGVNLFKPFTVGFNNSITKYLPSKSYQFVDQSGVSGFTFSSIDGAGNFIKNSNYVNAPTIIEKYNTNATPQVITDNSRVDKIFLNSDYFGNSSLAEITNAKLNNFAFSNFDLQTSRDFSILNGSGAVISPGRYSSNCLNMQPNVTLAREITKPILTKNIIVSFWLKDAETAGTISMCYSKFGNTPCQSIMGCGTNPIVSFTANNQWTYYQAIVPYPYWATSADGSFRCIVLGTSTGVKIDDVLIYPDNAGVTTYSYTTNSTIAPILLTAKTGINGIGNTFEYDKAGRLWITRDQYGNILEMKKFKLANKHVVQIPSIEIGYNIHGDIVNQPATLTAMLPRSYELGDCSAPPISYKWNFGDGGWKLGSSSGDDNGYSTIQHTYTQVGDYVVTVTASSPDMTDITAQTPPITAQFHVKVVNAPPLCNTAGTPVICASGIVQRTSTGQCILTNCPSLPPPTCTKTYFRLTDINGGDLSSVYSVKWEFAAIGSSNWNEFQQEIAGTAGFQTSSAFHPIHTNSYQMRAKIRFCDQNSNSITYSNIITVLNGD